VLLVVVGTCGPMRTVCDGKVGLGWTMKCGIHREDML
jgi:hypothetical protein